MIVHGAVYRFNHSREAIAMKKTTDPSNSREKIKNKGQLEGTMQHSDHQNLCKEEAHFGVFADSTHSKLVFCIMLLQLH